MDPALGVAAAGTVASTLFDYNRTGWNIDLLVKQTNRGQRQGLKLSEVSLFREDVRDTVQPAMQKQQNQILVITLILGMVSTCLTSVDVPAGTFMYLKSLSHLCVGSSLLYLVMALSFALAANYMASITQRELLTKMVRQPIIDMEDELSKAEQDETVENFEHQGVAAMFRVPGLSRAKRDLARSRSRSSSVSSDTDSVNSGSTVDSNTSDGSELTDYNRGESWKDEYRLRFVKKRGDFELMTTCASICAFLGVGNMLHSLSYTALARFFFYDGELWSSWTVAVQFILVHVLMVLGWNASFSSAGWRPTAWVETLAVVVGHAANVLCILQSTPQQLDKNMMTVTFMCHVLVCMLVFFRLSSLSAGEGDRGADGYTETADSGALVRPALNRRKPLVGSKPRRALQVCMLVNGLVAAVYVLSLVSSLHGLESGEVFGGRVATM